MFNSDEMSIKTLKFKKGIQSEIKRLNKKIVLPKFKILTFLKTIFRIQFDVLIFFFFCTFMCVNMPKALLLMTVFLYKGIYIMFC